MTLVNTLYLLGGLWLGTGFTAWAVPFYASLGDKDLSWTDALVLLICLCLGPIAMGMYARHERSER